jgi:multidrug efflux system membrane fusion protein
LSALPARQRFEKYRFWAGRRLSSISARTRLAAVIAGILAIAALWYLLAGGAGSGPDAHSNAAPVRVGQVVRRDMPVVAQALGTVVANTLVQVTARVQGTLDTANFKEGQFVKKGDLILRIDPRAFEVALDQARGMLLRDEALLGNAVRDRQRYENLHRQGAISDQLVATAATNAEVLAATVVVDQAAVKAALLNLSYTQIRSPVDGKTGPLLVQPGNMVAASNTTPLVTIAQIQPVKVSFNLPESDLRLIQSPQHARSLSAALDLKDAQGKPLRAVVDFTSNAVNGQSGTIELRATFDNADLSLVPGQLVNVTVELDRLHNVLVVPRNAINDGPKGSYVYVVVDGKAVQHDISVLFDDTKDAAIQSDLKVGDNVIVEGQLRVEANGAVQVMPSGKSAAGAHVAHRAGKPR